MLKPCPDEALKIWAVNKMVGKCEEQGTTVGDADLSNRLYRDSYDLTPLASVEVVGGLKGKCPARENIWLLKGRDV
jgi:hypothetical protein